MGAGARGSGRGPGTDGPRERLLRLGASALADAGAARGAASAGQPRAVGARARRGAARRRRRAASAAPAGPPRALRHAGAGPARAAQVLAALELGTAGPARLRTRGPGCARPREVYGLPAHRGSRALRREVFHVLCFNARNVLLARRAGGRGDDERLPGRPARGVRARRSSRRRPRSCSRTTTRPETPSLRGRISRSPAARAGRAAARDPGPRSPGGRRRRGTCRCSSGACCARTGRLGGGAWNSEIEEVAGERGVLRMGCAGSGPSARELPGRAARGASEAELVEARDREGDAWCRRSSLPGGRARG